MKIKILEPMAGVGISWKRNQIVDVDSAEGARLCAAGRAEALKEKREKAVKQPKEKAIKE